MGASIRTPYEVSFDLEEIRRKTLQGIALALLLVTYIALARMFLYRDSFTLDLLAPAALALGNSVALFLARRHLAAATVVFLLSLASANLGFASISGPDLAPYFSMMMIVLVGILLRPAHLFAFAGCTALALLGIAWLRPGDPALRTSVVYALVGMGAASLALWLVSRNLYRALQWAWDSYAEAREQREQARRRQGQLAAALKALDEAADRLQRLNYELSRAHDVAQEMRSLQQTFMANVSHELRTPLALITGFSEMLCLAPETYGVTLPTEFVADVQEIYHNSQHLLGLIDDVLDLSQVQSGKMRLRRESTSLRQIINDAVETIHPLLRGKGLELRLALDAALPVVNVDPTRIRQVLINLLNNARRFTEQGEIVLTARLNGARDEVQVTVADTGIGIAPAELGEIFQAFHQVGNPARSPNGSGLGLSISKDFVEMHGGRIWGESEGVPGKGCAFHFTLPLGPVAEIGKPTLQRTAPRPLYPGVSPRVKRTLLLSGADDDVLRVMEERLDRFKWVAAPEAARLPELVNEFLPLAVVLNAQPAEERAQLAETRQYLGDLDVPILLCACGKEKRLARAMGVHDYLLKPIKRGDIAQSLARLEEAPRRLLIVDDDPLFVRLLSRMLLSLDADYEMLRAYDGREGLEQLRAGDVDLVMLDLWMPEMNGQQFLEQMRQDASLAQTPVIVVTSKEYDLDDSRRLGGQCLMVNHRWGLSNEQTLAYLDSLLAALESGPVMRQRNRVKRAASATSQL